MTDPRPVPDAATICAALETVDGIRQVHDAHAWVAPDGVRGFAARVQIERPNAWDAVVASARTLLGERFDIAHSVLQPEANAVADLARQVQQARTDRDAAVRQGLEAEQQRDLNGELALQYERALEAERVRLGRVLNDELAQHATAIRAMAATFESRLAGREPTLAQLASLMVGNADACREAARLLLQRHKIYVQPINFPTVPRGTERFRLTPSPLHTVDDIKHLAEAMARILTVEKELLAAA